MSFIFILYHITISSAGHAAASLRALKGPDHNCENRNADANTFPACNLNAGPNTDGTVAIEGDTCMPCCECKCSDKFGNTNYKSKCMTKLSNGDAVEETRVCEGYGGGSFQTFDSATYSVATDCTAQCDAFCGL